MGISRASMARTSLGRVSAASSWSESGSRRHHLPSRCTGFSGTKVERFCGYETTVLVSSSLGSLTRADCYTQRSRIRVAWMTHPGAPSKQYLSRRTATCSRQQNREGCSNLQVHCRLSVPRYNSWAGRPMSWHTLRPLAAPFRPGQLPLRTIQLCASVGKEKSAEKSLWHKAVIQKNTMAAEELHLLECEVPIEIAQSYHTPGQYIMLRRDDSQEKPGFFAITSPPPLDGHDGGCFELLVKQVDATQWLCERQRGSFVELSAAQGRGFPTRDRFHNAIRHVLLFATGSGIAPIRAAIEDRGCLVGVDSIKLYYGCRNQNRMAYQDRFASWQKDRGVQVVPVLSQPVSSWNGARGYVQHALERDGILTPPAQTAVLVCGLRGMTTAVESYLLQHGIEKQHILYNF